MASLSGGKWAAKETRMSIRTWTKLAVVTLVAVGFVPTAGSEPPAPATAPAVEADDTGRNVRDRAGDTLTPMDQGTSESDLSITREIRRAVTDRDGFSTHARNVKIITRGGVVTLRGPVASAQEKAGVVEIARATAGVREVRDETEIDSD